MSDNGGMPDYNFETATEGERWAYDQGYEQGWEARLNPSAMELSDIRELMAVSIIALDRMLTEARPQPASGERSRGWMEMSGGAVIELPDDRPDDN